MHPFLKQITDHLRFGRQEVSATETNETPKTPEIEQTAASAQGSCEQSLLQGQNAVHQSLVRPTDDPSPESTFHSYSPASRSAAYEADAKSMKM